MSHFDRAREELEIEFNSRYDYVTEAYAGMDDTAGLEAEMEACGREWDEEMTALFGPRVVEVPDVEIPF